MCLREKRQIARGLLVKKYLYIILTEIKTTIVYRILVLFLETLVAAFCKKLCLYFQNKIEVRMTGRRDVWRVFHNFWTTSLLHKTDLSITKSAITEAAINRPSLQLPIICDILYYILDCMHHSPFPFLPACSPLRSLFWHNYYQTRQIF